MVRRTRDRIPVGGWSQPVDVDPIGRSLVVEPKAVGYRDLAGPDVVGYLGLFSTLRRLGFLNFLGFGSLLSL